MSEEWKQPHVSEDVIYQPEALRLTSDARAGIYRSILEASTLDPEYLAMLMLAALIALFGLLQNSAAVIIGAMLISPLMNPILAGGLALILGDWRLGRKSAAVVALSVGAAILATWFVSEMVPLRQPTAEILARTNPNLLDMFIAMLSGLAGTLAMRSSSSAFTIIPGVAIAVAVVPPLSTVGYGLSSGDVTIAAGAFLLFVTNLVSIMICAGLVFLVFGFRPHAETEKGHLKLKYRMAISAVVLAVLAVPLVQTLRTGVQSARTRSEVTRIVEKAFKTSHSSVGDLAVNRGANNFVVRATVRTTEYFDDEAVTEAREALRAQLGPETRLEVDQILVTQGGLPAPQAARLRDFISGRMAQTSKEEPPYDLRKSGDQFLSHLQRNIQEVVAPSGGVIRLNGPLTAQLGPGQPMVIKLPLASGEPLVPQTLQLLAGQLSTKLTYPIQLHARVALEGDGYYLRIEKPSLREGLSAADRQAFSKFASQLAGQHSFSLDISVANLAEPASQETLPLQGDIDELLSRSRLAATQWNIRRMPPPPPGSQVPSPGSAENAAVPAVRVEARVFQEM